MKGGSARLKSGSMSRLGMVWVLFSLKLSRIQCPTAALWLSGTSYAHTIRVHIHSCYIHPHNVVDVEGNSLLGFTCGLPFSARPLEEDWSKRGGIAKMHNEQMYIRCTGALTYLPGSSLSPEERIMTAPAQNYNRGKHGAEVEESQELFFRLRPAIQVRTYQTQQTQHT
ncbi:hypothetical protein B0H19DRAFT_1071504 [Mycena capillaripes]|nr:hypothetical protein B0H19DRAFT_1071504 [Mycena capillaripes]